MPLPLSLSYIYIPRNRHANSTRPDSNPVIPFYLLSSDRSSSRSVEIYLSSSSFLCKKITPSLSIYLSPSLANKKEKSK